jgi:hypothetical protein
MSTNDLIFGLLIGMLFGLLNNLEDSTPKNYRCPDYCGVIHIHIGVKHEEKEPDKQGPLRGDKYIAYDDEPTDASDNNDIGSSQ